MVSLFHRATIIISMVYISMGGPGASTGVRTEPASQHDVSGHDPASRMSRDRALRAEGRERPTRSAGFSDAKPSRMSVTAVVIVLHRSLMARRRVIFSDQDMPAGVSGRLLLMLMLAVLMTAWPGRVVMMPDKHHFPVHSPSPRRLLVSTHDARIVIVI